MDRMAMNTAAVSGTDLTGVPVLVIGAGTMGTGIAQLAAQAGHVVYLFDERPGAAAQAALDLAATWDKLAGKGKFAPETARACAKRLLAIDAIAQARDSRLAIEAVVEDLDVKRGLIRELEAVLGEAAVLATNTSSISITALAAAMQRPQRLVGMHFFNPAALMKLVEVVSGLRTDRAVTGAVRELCRAWGKVPVLARSTPGFIVNRIARPLYAETWALLQEQSAAPDVIDACIRGAGFRMGPCALMDLIGHDVNFAVTQSVYQAFYGDKRYQPSMLQREMVDAGWLGRKSGHGFYDYIGTQEDGAATVPAVNGEPPKPAALCVHGRGSLPQQWLRSLRDKGYAPQHLEDGAFTGLSVEGAQLRLTDGRPATHLSVDQGVSDIVVFDLPPSTTEIQPALAFGVSAHASSTWADQAPRWLRVLGYAPRRITDTAALVVARTIAMIVNEAADAVCQGVCTERDADQAMKLGANYPAGPFEWLDRWGAARIVTLIDHLDAHYRGERYRVSPALRHRAWTASAFARETR